MQLLPNAQVFQGYGMTESSPVSFLNPWRKIKHGTIGVAIPNVTFKVVDVDTLEPVGPGGEGELRVKGPNVCAHVFSKAKLACVRIMCGMPTLSLFVCPYIA